MVTVVGDGGFLFASNELATAMQHGIHTVTVVFDDGAYGNSNRDQREKFGGRELGTALENPDWVMLAHAFGAEGIVVDDIGKLAAVMDGGHRSDHRGVGHLDGDRGADGSSAVTLLIRRRASASLQRRERSPTISFSSIGGAEISARGASDQYLGTRG